METLIAIGVSVLLVWVTVYFSRSGGPAAPSQQPFDFTAWKKQRKRQRWDNEQRQKERRQAEAQERQGRTEREQRANEESRRQAGHRQRENDERAEREQRQADEAAIYGNILGLQGQVTVSDIKKAYRFQAARYHPDKVAHLGTEFQLLAEQRTKELNEAYLWFRQMYKF